MIHLPAIWWLFPAASMLLILSSLYLTRSGNRARTPLQKVFVALGALLGFAGLSLPLFEQPVFSVPIINYGLGIPLAVIGLVGRVFPMVYLRRQGTTTAMDSVEKLVDSGPYAWVRHPQYTAGLVMLLGWFVAWGAWYALGFVPLVAGIIYVQARIEEECILEAWFGKAYADYRERVGMLLPRLARNNSLRITTGFLGVYAGLIAIQHGIFAILQGSRAPDGLLFNALGSPCEPEAVWHACFPAMTLLPNLLITGIAAVLVGLGMAVWAVAFAGRRHGGLVLAMLSVLALLVGGGFVPVWIGLVAAAAGGIRAPVKPGGAVRRILAALWPWPLLLMAAWMPGSWLLGHFFGPAMLALAGPLFIVFDVGMPVLAAFSGFATKLTKGS